MNWWGGSREDSDKQASERAARQARRTIAAQPKISSDSEDDHFAECDLSGSFLLNLDGADDVEETAEGNIMPPAVIIFEDVNGEDDADYYKKLSSLKNRNFNKQEVEFWFTSIETSLKHLGVKSQWAKREILQSLMPEDVQGNARNFDMPYLYNE